MIYFWMSAQPKFVAESEPPPLSPSPTPFIFQRYSTPTLEKNRGVHIFLVGDSMTDGMGPHPFILSQKLNEAYPDTGFVIDNYSKGSRNLEELEKLLTTDSVIDGKDEPAALERPVDILIIESFGQNPLSHLPLNEGLKKQEEILTTVMTKVVKEHPSTVVIFLATIGPDPVKFADGLLNLPAGLKEGYVRERQAYIENHIAYAKDHNIPLINLYEKSKTADGRVNLNYLRTSDYLHPSQEGVDWMQREIAQFILDNEYIPD